MRKWAEKAEKEALTKLQRHPAITITNKTIYAYPHIGIGIKTWGIIDFLCNYQGYKLILKE